MRALWLLIIPLLLLADVVIEDFESTPVGKIPKGWQVAATHPGNRLAKWAVEKEGNNHILSLVRPGSSAFNLCYNPKLTFKEGKIAVRFRANSGRIDQGGGIAWRIQDANNYFVVRYNPLEDNFRLYYVKHGWRHQIAGANIHLLPGWHQMSITHKGERITASLDGKKLLQARSKAIPWAGGVGVWTKADAVTSFDDLKVWR